MREITKAMTNDLRKLIKSMLLPVCGKVYYMRADEDNIFPHIVFTLRRVKLDDLTMKAYTAEIELWDKDTIHIEEMCDEIERIFNNNNKPQETILPTFFIESRETIIDEDKTIQHRLIKIECQNYEV